MRHAIPSTSTTAVSWTNGAGGDWATAANWSTGQVPNSNDAVTINTASLQTITYSTGNDTIYSLSVGNDIFDMSGGSLDILKNAGFSHGFIQTGGTFEGGLVTIAGSGTLTGGSSEGATTLSITGTAALANYTLGGSSALKNAKAINQTGQITLGDNTGVDATITNGAAGIYAIAGDFGVNGGAASALIVNAGTLEKSAGNGTSAINTTVTSSGTISAASGDLQLNGPSNIIRGALAGAGEISFGGGGNTSLTLGTATIGALGLTNTAFLSLAGTSSVLNGTLLDQSSGTNTLALNAGTFTVNGAADFVGNFGVAYVSGTGSLVLEGDTTASNVQFGGKLTIDNQGVFTEAGQVTLGDGSNGIVKLQNLAGATYELTTNDGVGFTGSSASSIVNAGIFSKTGGGSVSTVSVSLSNQAAATINAASGEILFTSALTNAGTITGAGQVAITGSATLSAGTTLTVAQLGLFNTGLLTLGTSLTYGGVFADDSSGNNTLALGKNTLTLTGTQNSILGNFGQATISGTGGGLLNSAAATLTIGQAILGGTDTLTNDGVVNQTGTVTIGDASGNAARIANLAGSTWNITNALTVNDGASAASVFANAGTVTVTAGTGTATLGTFFNNLAGATVDIVSGSLQNAGLLTNVGTITGTDLSLAGSSETTLMSGDKLLTTSLDLTNTATLNLAAAQTYTGAFNDLSGGSDTINLAGHGFVLTGHATFIGSFGSDIINGPGTLTVSGATSLSGVELGGTANFTNVGTLLASGGLQIGDGSSNAATFLNGSKGIYDIVADNAGISHGASVMSDFLNAGLFEKTAGTGTTVISSAFTNNGTITVTSGIIEFTAGSLVNNGTINGVISTDQNGNIFITHH
jgi:hypothetical protein